MTIQLPLWIAVSVKRFWTRPPEMRFLLFDEDKNQPATVNAAVTWEYDEPSRLLPFVSVIVSVKGGMGKETIKASVGKEGSSPVFWRGNDFVGHSEWGTFLSTSTIHDANGCLIASMRGWPFAITRKIVVGNTVARIRREKLEQVKSAFAQFGKVGRIYVLESADALQNISALVLVDWICMVSVGYGTRPNPTS